MADEDDDSGTHGATNGQQQRLMTRDEMAARDKAAFLAGEDIDEPAPKKGKPSKAVVEPDEDDDLEDDERDQEDDEDEVRADDDGDDEDADPDEEEDSDDDDDDDDDDDEDPDAEKPDAETSKRLDRVRRTEQRARDAVRREREGLERDKATFARERDELLGELKPRLAELDKFESLKSKVRTRPLDVLVALGLKPEDFGDAARQLFAETEEGAKDPRYKALVADRIAKRELEERLAAMEKKDSEREKIEQQRAEQATKEAALDKYFVRVEKFGVSDETPIAKRRLASNKTADKARADIAAQAYRLAQKLGGKLPHPKSVMRAYEKQVRRELEADGVDVAALAKAPLPAKKSKTIAVDDRTKKTTDSVVKTTRAPNGHSKWEPPPSRDEMLRELAELDRQRD